MQTSRNDGSRNCGERHRRLPQRGGMGRKRDKGWSGDGGQGDQGENRRRRTYGFAKMRQKLAPAGLSAAAARARRRHKTG
jgi:hypothetical protein